jgi:hypothetical protein
MENLKTNRATNLQGARIASASEHSYRNNTLVVRLLILPQLLQIQKSILEMESADQEYVYFKNTKVKYKLIKILP